MISEHFLRYIHIYEMYFVCGLVYWDFWLHHQFLKKLIFVFWGPRFPYLPIKMILWIGAIICIYAGCLSDSVQVLLASFTQFGVWAFSGCFTKHVTCGLIFVFIFMRRERLKPYTICLLKSSNLLVIAIVNIWTVTEFKLSSD